MRSAGESLRALIADADYWRGPPSDETTGPLYKEWQHFVIFGVDATVVLNLNLDGGGRGRVIRIVIDREWRGIVLPCREPRVRSGRLDATFDRAGMRWDADRYAIWQHDDGFAMEVTLQPASAPSLSHNIGLGPGAHLSWCLVPRLHASGWFEIAGRRTVLDRCLAYHDHNWGRFGWGGDFSWEWGCAVAEDPASPWTVIFARMNDRARHRTSATSVFLLKEGAHFRYFRNAEVRFETDEAPYSRPAGRVPAAAALILPDVDCDVPSQTRFLATRDDNVLQGTIEAGTRGQVLIPAEADLRRIVRLNEVDARVRVEGRCGGESVLLRGPGLLEVLRG